MSASTRDNSYFCFHKSIGMKRYNLLTGLVLSLFIAFMVFMPRVARNPGATVVQYAVTSFVYTLSCWMIIQLFIQHAHPRNFWFRLVCSLFICLFLTYARFFLARQLSWELPEVLSSALSEQQQNRAIFIRTLLNNGLLIFVSYLLFLSGQAQLAQLEVSRIKQDNLEARLFSLQQQISPHFLFNSLTTLRSIAPDPATKQYVQQLATVYRYLLTANDLTLATLEAELEFTRSYLYILQERFEDGLRVSISIDEAVLSRRVPPATLQILVENAIKHNVVSHEHPLLLTLTNPGDSDLEVRNTLRPRRSVEDGAGIGLQNVRERYLLLSGQPITIVKTETDFIVSIPLLL